MEKAVLIASVTNGLYLFGAKFVKRWSLELAEVS